MMASVTKEVATVGTNEKRWFELERELTMAIISGKYKATILWNLGWKGPMRYGEIQRIFVNISNRMLTKQLRELERDGVVQRDVYPDSPPKVEYSLTNMGETLLPVLQAIYQWGADHIDFYRKRAEEEQHSEE